MQNRDNTLFTFVLIRDNCYVMYIRYFLSNRSEVVESNLQVRNIGRMFLCNRKASCADILKVGVDVLGFSSVDEVESSSYFGKILTFHDFFYLLLSINRLLITIKFQAVIIVRGTLKIVLKDDYFS